MPAGNVTETRLFAPADNPPVAEVVKPTTYCVRAPAPADGEPFTADTPVSRLAAGLVAGELTGLVSEVVETSSV